ncbi:MAG TPA: low-specificity L-threonine aldolase [bacterium]|nr:low-specificity L-threonine aldolase [bacterium]
MIDLRSDTVTRPTAGMRRAMAEAEVGDDVLGDDPTVNRLQETVAAMLGKEAGLFVPSGTMANQIAVKTHTRPGDEVICEAGAHVYVYEAGAPAFLSGVQMRPIAGKHGVMDVADVEAAIRPQNVHHPVSRLICLENTHNRAGGTVCPIENIREIRALADRTGLRMHLDGARLWNAHVATGIPLAEYAGYFDSVSVCFSKGLGAPVGSLIAGDGAFIRDARRFRKIFGGGMRQAGILAAAALYAVEHHLRRLGEDHARAGRLAGALSAFDGVDVDLESVQTNILFFSVASGIGSAERIVERLREQGILVLALPPRGIRAVTHLDVEERDIETVIAALPRIFSA